MEKINSIHLFFPTKKFSKFYAKRLSSKTLNFKRGSCTRLTLRITVERFRNLKFDTEHIILDRHELTIIMRKVKKEVFPAVSKVMILGTILSFKKKVTHCFCVTVATKSSFQGTLMGAPCRTFFKCHYTWLRIFCEALLRRGTHVNLFELRNRHNFV